MKTKQQIMREYKKEAQEILYEMVKLLGKEQLKTDNVGYNKMLVQLDKNVYGRKY